MEEKALAMADDPAFLYLRQAAKEVGVKAWAVGGFVRDLLLGRESYDLDVVVEGSAPDLASYFAQITNSQPPVVYARFGTASIRWGERQIEFVTAREESYASNSRKPVVRPTTIINDLLRRDFTCNAILLGLDGKIQDPLGGLEDLHHKVLRTPVEPRQTFSDDPLRMLRAIRLAVQLSFTFSKEILPAMVEMKERVGPPVVSQERISVELQKMFLSPSPGTAYRLLVDSKLLGVIMPELKNLEGPDLRPEFLDQLNSTRSNLEVRLASLFLSPNLPSPMEAALNALTRLRFSSSVVQQVQQVLQFRPGLEKASNEVDFRRFLRRAGKSADIYLEFYRLSELARGRTLEEYEDKISKIQALQSLGRQAVGLDLPVDGEDIMRELKLRPSEDVGKIKSRISDMVLEGKLPSDRQAILNWLRQGSEKTPVEGL